MHLLKLFHTLFKRGFIILFLMVNACVVFVSPLAAQKNAAARYEIDAKRIGVYPGDKDALPRSREFIRLDSTYYVGWMYEGLYKFERSADYLGYRYAIVPLYKALVLLEKDYGDQLKNIYTSFTYFQQYGNRYNDFSMLANALKTSYNSIELPDSTMSLLSKIESYNFQKDYFSVNVERAWTIHRSRFFTSEKYNFLKNSIEENEVLAYKCCYEQIASIKKNKAKNDLWYGLGQSEDDLMTVYHYIALLHDYNQQYDSSEYYYKLLIDGGRVSWGNYGHLQEEIGNFGEAIYNFSKSQYRSRYSLNESGYYLPSLLIFCGRTKDAINMAQEKIAESPSTPGFGWYNIALARSYLYDGQLDSCDFFLTKAANFKELHIGTTLTQSQYDFTINLLRIQLLDKKLDLVKFFNPGWWYSFSDLYTTCALKLEKLMLEYSVVNAVAHNPERKRIIYDLFCGESTVTFDESLYLMKEFSLPFFQKKYENYPVVDKRKKIYRYFNLFEARFKYERGNDEDALNECRHILDMSNNDPGQEYENVIDTATEKLFLARVYETMALTDDEGSSNGLMSAFYNQFPQLVPFSGIKMKMNLNFSGENDAVIKEVIDEIKDCNIEITSEESTYIPQGFINFTKKGKNYEAEIYVNTRGGRGIMQCQRLIFDKPEDVGKELALRLFGKGGAIKFESPEPKPKKPEDKKKEGSGPV